MSRPRTLASGVLLLAVLTGCQQSGKPKVKSAQANASAPPAQQPSQPEPPRPEARSAGEIIGNAAQNVRRGAARQQAKGIFENVGLFYHQFHAENGRAPANRDEFFTYIKKDAPQIVQIL